MDKLGKSPTSVTDLFLGSSKQAITPKQHVTSFRGPDGPKDTLVKTPILDPHLTTALSHDAVPYRYRCGYSSDLSPLYSFSILLISIRFLLHERRTMCFQKTKIELFIYIYGERLPFAPLACADR